MDKPLITSTSNPHIKTIRKLKDRKYRSDSGLFFIEGIRITIEALNTFDWIEQLIVARDLISNEKGLEAIRLAEKKKIEILEVNREVFESISGKDGPQGLAAVCKQRWLSISELDVTTTGPWIALYQVADPGNLGTILRTLDGMGGAGIILLNHCTDPFDPTAVRASMGTIFNKKIIKSSLQDFIDWKNRQGISLIGTSDSAKKDYREYHYPDPMILLMGSEREGIPVELVKICNALLSIPMVGVADSLNLAVASSIILYEIASQRKNKPK